MDFVIYFYIFLMGITFGSFFTLAVYRIPLGQDITHNRSYCPNCNHKLSNLDLIPLFSYIFLRGKCRYCKTKISAQYPVIEAVNGFGYVLIFIMNGFNFTGILYALCFSMLTAITVIDWRTYEIPLGLNITILVLGAIHLALDYHNFLYYLIGMVSVSGFLLLLFIITGGRGIGGGDIKLMFAAGLLLGWKHIILALVIGCIIGSIVHLTLMRIKGKGRVLAFGPYLSIGIFTVMLFGSQILDWYIGLLF